MLSFTAAPKPMLSTKTKLICGFQAAYIQKEKQKEPNSACYNIRQGKVHSRFLLKVNRLCCVSCLIPLRIIIYCLGSLTSTNSQRDKRGSGDG